MKGIAAVPLILAALFITSTAAVVTTFYNIGTQPATNSRDPAEIVSTAVANTPWADFYDLFFGGLFGVLLWIDRYLLWPLLNWVANMVAFIAGNEWGSVKLPLELAHIVLAMLIGILVWKKKDSIWTFITDKLMIVLIFLSVVFVVGIVLAFMGVI